MKLPLSYQLDALDGSSAERSAILQDIRDRGILEAADLTAFCFKIEALLDHAEARETELLDELRDARQDQPSIAKIREIAEAVFDDLFVRLPKSADLIRERYIELLRSMT